MEHSFNIYIAERYGIPSAVLLKNIYFWIEKNRANETNFYDGFYWTYNSKKAFADLFPYLTTRQIDYALQKLIDDGLLITGNYNKVAYDRTLWYAITEKGYSILQNCEMETTKSVNAKPEIERTIPYKNTDIQTDKNTYSVKARTRFTPPTLDEVKAYCSERNNTVDAQRFIDYYTANGWKVGRNAMKDWRASVRTWERDDKPAPKQSAVYGSSKDEYMTHAYSEEQLNAHLISFEG